MQKVNLDAFKNKKIALVLSGGVTKAAAWHIGVATALEELGISLKSNASPPSELEIETYVGSSAGAFMGTYFASGLGPRDLIETSVRGGAVSRTRPLNYKDILCLKRPSKPEKGASYNPFVEFPAFLKLLLNPLSRASGIFTTQGIKKYLEEYVLEGRAFEEYKANLFIVTTQLDHSRKIIFSKHNYPSPTGNPTAVYETGVSISDAAAASMSVPPFFSPFPISHSRTDRVDYYIDGGNKRNPKHSCGH